MPHDFTPDFDAALDALQHTLTEVRSHLARYRSSRQLDAGQHTVATLRDLSRTAGDVADLLQRAIGLDDYAYDVRNAAEMVHLRRTGMGYSRWSLDVQLAVALVLRDDVYLNQIRFTRELAAETVLAAMTNPPVRLDDWLRAIRLALGDRELADPPASTLRLPDAYAQVIFRRAAWARDNNGGRPHPDWPERDRLAVAIVMLDGPYMEREHGFTPREALRRLRELTPDLPPPHESGSWFQSIRDLLAETVPNAG